MKNKPFTPISFYYLLPPSSPICSTASPTHFIFFISVKKQLYEINLKGLIKIHLQITGLLIFFFFDHEVLIIFLFFHENMAQVLITFVRQFMWVMWVDAKMCLWAYADSEGPDQPAHTLVMLNKDATPIYLSANQNT